LDLSVAAADPAFTGAFLPLGAIPTGGATGQVLAKVSGTNYDTAWEFLGSSVASTEYFSVLSSGATSTIPTTFNTFSGGLTLLTQPIAIDRLVIEVTTASIVSGAVLRLGVYHRDAAGIYNLIVDGGTVSAETTGVKEVTVSAVLPAGVIVLGAAIQGLPNNNNRPATRSFNAFFNNLITSSSTFFSSNGAMSFSSVSGALPPTPTFTSTGIGPIVNARAA
jgi:hypothetical protein